MQSEYVLPQERENKNNRERSISHPKFKLKIIPQYTYIQKFTLH